MTTHAIDDYWERFAANANGWRRQFPDILVYTFDRVEQNVPENLHAMIEELCLNPKNETLLGKCVRYATKEGPAYSFIFGGGGNHHVQCSCHGLRASCSTVLT